MKKYVLYIALMAGAVSCIYPYTPDLETAPDRTLVVDGQILLGGYSTLKLDYLTPLDGSSAGIPQGRRAWIEDNEGNKYLPDQASGNVITIDTRTVSSTATQFRAFVEVDTDSYVSDWLEPDPAPEITQIHFSADDNLVTVSVDVNTGMEGGYLGFLYEETWEFHSDFYPDYYVKPGEWAYQQYQDPYPYYWCWRSVTPPQITLLDYSTFSGGQVDKFPIKSFARSDSRNHKRYSINVKAFALSREAYQFNKQVQEMSEIGGDLFTPDPGGLPTNLVCESDPGRKVMGLVLAGKVTSKRAYLDSRFLKRVSPMADFVKVSQEEMPKYYEEMNYRPVIMAAFDDGADVGWLPHRCINCIEAGGTQERPDFWEDE